MKKIILLVIDGLGDEKIPELNNKTPLEAAKIPNMNSLAEKGICGEVIPFWFKKQHYPRSDSAHLALFGYNPKDKYLGRGPYEAAALDIDFKEGDLAFRINFGTVKDKKIIDRRAGRIKNNKPFVKALQGINIKGVEFILKSGIEHRGALILRSEKKLSKEITNGDPKETGVSPKKIKAKKNTKEAKFTAEILNEYFEKTHQILKDHPQNQKRKEKGLYPANYLLSRGAGTFKEMEDFKDKFGLKAGSITGGGVYKGVSKIVGMEIIKKGERDTFGDDDLKFKFNLLKEKIKEYDFIFCHIKKIDNLSHDGNFKGKKDFLEKIDKEIKILLDSLNDKVITITGDHTTSCLKKEHSTNSIPILIFGGAKDEISTFSEERCKEGKLGKINQVDIMEKILKIAKS